jgi:23S rRNA (adenine2503-C2)-methyltransferase
MQNFFAQSEASLRALFEELGEKPYRVAQLIGWVYHQGVRDFDAMTNLSKEMRTALKERFHFALPRIEKKTTSLDGTVKYLFALEDGARVESVWIPNDKHRTLCMSTQVGCRLACAFCMTATLGLKRNMTADEFLGQYLAVNADLPEESRITNVVIMGMGEPLDNYDVLMPALKLMVSPEGMRVASRRLTLSTSGLVDRLRQYATEDLQINLAISLNATEDKTRDWLMPINKKYPIAVLLDCLRDFPLKKRQRITFEYVLLDGINDTDADAVRLARLLRGFPCKINLIPFNGNPVSEFHPPPLERVLAFQSHLMAKNYTAFIRKTRGDDILGACGQLAAESRSSAIPALTH